MSKIVLSTESVADLPKHLIEKYQIQEIPMHVIIDGKDDLENEISVEEVYDYYRRTKKSSLQHRRMHMNIIISFRKLERTFQIT